MPSTYDSLDLLWRDGRKVERQRDIAQKEMNEVRSVVRDAGSTVNQSRLLGQIIQFNANDDALARTEEYLDDQLVDDVGVPPSTDMLVVAENKKSQPYTEDEYEDAGIEEDVKITLPDVVFNEMREAAPSPRKQSYWLTCAIRRYMDSPFASRMERIETKRQLLEAADGEEPPEDERTAVYERIRKSDLYPGVRRAVFGDVEDDDGRRVIDVDDVASVDWDGIGIDDDVVVDISLPHRDDICDVPKTASKRIPASMAAVRGMWGDDQSPTRPQVARLVDNINDYSDASRIVDAVWEQVQTEYGINGTDGPVDESHQELASLVRSTSSMPRVDRTVKSATKHIHGEPVHPDDLADELTVDELERVIDYLKG